MFWGHILSFKSASYALIFLIGNFLLCNRNWSIFTVQKEGVLCIQTKFKKSLGPGTRFPEKKIDDDLSLASQAV